MANRPLQLYRLHVSLRWSDPPIWRQLQVPGNRSLHVLHQILQVAMGWEFSHLHEFMQGDRHYGEPDPELEYAGFETIDSRRVSLARIVPEVGSTFTYLYDFGDSWRHEIAVEAIIPTTARIRSALCLDGARACPPEDVGSIPGYEEFCAAIADPSHPRHEELQEWIGRPFDPEALDLDAINRALVSLR